jgi:hypothetical protein
MAPNGIMHPPPTPLPLGYSNGLNAGSAHSYHLAPRGSLPNTPHRRVMSQPQHVSARALMMSTPDSPATFNPETPGHKTRPSLVGFDPLLVGAAVPPAPLHRPPPPPPFNNVRAPLTQAAAPMQPSTPQPSQTQDKSRQHRREVQSFCVSDFRDIAQKASEEEEEPKEKRSSSQERTPKADESEETRTQPTPKYDSDENAATSHEQTSPKPKRGPISRKEFFTISIPTRKERSVSPVTPKDTDSDSSGAGVGKAKDTKIGAGIIRKLPWPKGKKGHRRTQSLESSEGPPSAENSKVEARRSSSTHERAKTPEPKPETKTSMYNSIVKDLMELSFDKLQLPTLAKPSPTSFLVGHENEVMRTCEYAAAPFQMEIPGVSELIVPARLNEFVENYRRIDQNFDLQEWKGMSSMDLRRVEIVQHIPIAQLLLESGNEVSIQGTINVGSNADNRLEVVIFEGQQNFIVVIRGTTEQQSKPCPKKTTNRKAVPLDAEHENVEVYQCFLDEYQKIEQKCFTLLDKLTEEHLFCDVVFTGHSFGAALSTLAALRYSNARPMMRVKCYPMASPKVGFSEFRRMVNSSPNLQVMRLEYGQDGKCQLPSQGGSHVGHTLVFHGSLGHNSHKTKDPVQAYKFDAPKHKKFKTTHPDLRSYVVALEEMSRLNLRWPKDFVGTSGEGVVVNNEARQMV